MYDSPTGARETAAYYGCGFAPHSIVRLILHYRQAHSTHATVLNLIPICAILTGHPGETRLTLLAFSCGTRPGRGGKAGRSGRAH